VGCAIDLQVEMARQEGFGPAAQRIRFRIGISAGEVLIVESEVYGSTVNVAARLQAMAGAGEIVLSGEAFDQLEAPIAARCDELGSRRLRKMATTLRVYKIPRSALRRPLAIDRAA
jgi:adenylate cyclase